MMPHYDVKLLFVLPILLFATKAQSQNIQSSVLNSGVPSRRSCGKDFYCTRPENCGYFTENECSSAHVRRVCCPRSGRSYVPPARTKKPTTTLQPVVMTAPGDLNDECGYSALQAQNPYIRDGVNAKEGAWPWMAVIKVKPNFGRRYTPTCSGFVIDRKHVITAAHCINNSRAYTVGIGSVDVEKTIDFPVEEYFVHEKYIKDKHENDIAILKLKREVNVTPLCLPDEIIVNKNLTGFGTTVAGWGRETTGGRMSKVLNQLSEIPVLPYEDCEKLFKSYGVKTAKRFRNGLESDFICAKYLDKYKDACQGDSGGPLMFQDRDKWFVVGIVAFGTDCKYRDFPSAYTKVSKHLNWIKETIKN